MNFELVGPGALVELCHYDPPLETSSQLETLPRSMVAWFELVRTQEPSPRVRLLLDQCLCLNRYGNRADPPMRCDYLVRFESEEEQEGLRRSWQEGHLRRVNVYLGWDGL